MALFGRRQPDAIAQFRDDNLKLVLAPQAYSMLEEKGRGARVDSYIAAVLAVLFAVLLVASIVDGPWSVADWPHWSRVAGLLVGFVGLPAAVGAFGDARAEYRETDAEAAALDRFLSDYDRDPRQARATALRMARSQDRREETNPAPSA